MQTAPSPQYDCTAPHRGVADCARAAGSPHARTAAGRRGACRDGRRGCDTRAATSPRFPCLAADAPLTALVCARLRGARRSLALGSSDDGQGKGGAATAAACRDSLLSPLPLDNLVIARAPRCTEAYALRHASN